VELYDEYEAGKIMTWYGTTQYLMNQLVGSAATFFTLNTNKACDISSLSFHGNDKSMKYLRK